MVMAMYRMQYLGVTTTKSKTVIVNISVGHEHLLSIQSRLSLDPAQSCIYLSARVFQSVPTPLRYATDHERTTTRALCCCHCNDRASKSSRLQRNHGCGNRQSPVLTTRQCMCVGGGRQRWVGVTASVNTDLNHEMGGATFTTLSTFVLGINILMFCNSKQT
jgi:hypothetical protein